MTQPPKHIEMQSIYYLYNIIKMRYSLCTISTASSNRDIVYWYNIIKIQVQSALQRTSTESKGCSCVLLSEFIVMI